MANCRGCNAPIMWAITEDGKRAPLDPTPSQAGNVLVWRPASPVGAEVHCATFAGETLATLVAHGVPLRCNHFSTCAVADRFRPTGRMTVAQVMAMAPNATAVKVHRDSNGVPWAQVCVLAGPVTDDEVATVQRSLDLAMIGETWTVKREMA